MKIFRCLEFALFLVLLCSGCSSVSYETVPMSIVATKGLLMPGMANGDGSVTVLPAEDSRKSLPAGEANLFGRLILGEPVRKEVSGDVSWTVSSALASVFGASKNGEIKLRPTVQKWDMDIVSRFAWYNIASTAHLTLDVLRKGELVYRGNYIGELNLVEMYPRNSRLREILGDTMLVAIKEAVKDPNLAKHTSFDARAALSR